MQQPQQNPQNVQSAPSFSVHSIADSSGPAISEVEEIHEVHKLLKTGEHAFKTRSFQHALHCYNEALEIDDLSLESYAGRAAVYIELGNYILAQRDAEKVISMEPQNTQGHYLLGISLHNLGYFRESLLSFLKALDLDSDNNHVEVLTNNIATIASQICDIPEELLHNIPEMDPYKKLTEVGCCLYTGKKHDLCIRVLTAAQKLETNQKGITMKVQLTLANGHAALKHNELAISLYQECLQTAISAHDASYQTKALVSIASLFLELADTHNAVVNYRKLLDLQRELQGEHLDAPLPEYWSMDLQCALHLNLSIAYKTIGAMQKAVQHAEIYCTLIKDYNQDTHKNAQARSHQNVGMLYELLGDYHSALTHYQKYLSLSKAEGDKTGTAQAYGCLGSVYAHLGNAHLALTYHDQHIHMAKGLKNEKVCCTAAELKGDTCVVLDNYPGAVESYTDMFNLCPHSDLKGQTTALCKLGSAYRHQGRHQYSMYYFEQARQIAIEYKYSTVRVMCEYNMACMLQYSTQMTELDRARGYFGKLIPIYEGKLQQHQEEDTFCPHDLRRQLDQCYDGIQNVLAKIGYSNECLQYSETQKRKSVIELTQSQHVSGGKYLNTLALYDAWTVEKISRVVSQQNASVLYYQVLPKQLLIWVLRPGEGVVRFYAGQGKTSSEDYDQLIMHLLEDIKDRRDLTELQYECENRALQFKDTELRLEQQRNRAMSKAADYPTEDLSDEIDRKMESSRTGTRLGSSKSTERQLFDLLIAPIDDILSKCEEDSPLIIIPDKVLYTCPFNQITDWNGKKLEERLRITVCPSLYTMDRVMQNELEQLKLQDDLEFERTQARLGGIAKTMQNIDFMRIAVGSPEVPAWRRVSGRGNSRSSTGDQLDLKRVSNPRLVTSGGANRRLEPLGLSRDSTMVSMKSLASIKEGPSTPRSKKLGLGMNSNAAPYSSTTSLKFPQSTNSLATIDKLVGAHTLTTLTTRTSTNTDIVQSHQLITEFSQLSDKDRCVVIGSPKLPEKVLLHGREWRPPSELRAAQAECGKVADYCNVPAIVGEEATKQRFLKELQTAAVIHIATFACLKENLLVFTPNPSASAQGPPTMHSYCVSAADIVELRLVARLVVLSCGFGAGDRKYVDDGFVLPSAFLTAGAQCVLTMLWSLPNKALDKFYFHMYSQLQGGAYVSKAVNHAAKQLKADDRYAKSSYWAAPIVIGKDVYLSIKFIRHAQLDQTLDKVEKEVSEDAVKPPLNPRPLIPNADKPMQLRVLLDSMTDREANLTVLQECMATILADHTNKPDVIVLLTSLVDDGIKRLHVSDINHRTVTLPIILSESEGAIRLVKFLGFHFQPQGEHFSEPYVIFPHWNHDDMLIPAFEALRAISELSENPSCSQAIHELLPTTQDTVSYLVDMFCITKHAPEIQLKVTDLSVKPLWKNRTVRLLLHHLGYHQIGTLLYFNNVPSGRKLLTAALQLLIAVSSHKSAALLHKLDVNLLGAPASHKGSTTTLDLVRLPSLTPLILPRNQLRMSTPWVSTVEKTDEMNEKMKLSHNASDLTSEYQFYISKARTWHEASVAPQADASLCGVGRPESTPLKVKVLPGLGPSHPRVAVDHRPPATLPQADQRRDYAHYILRQRVGDIELRQKNDVRKIYMPYVVNA